VLVVKAQPFHAIKGCLCTLGASTVTVYELRDLKLPPAFPLLCRASTKERHIPAKSRPSPAQSALVSCNSLGLPGHRVKLANTSRSGFPTKREALAAKS
jgi:hypothetical protein